MLESKNKLSFISLHVIFYFLVSYCSLMRHLEYIFISMFGLLIRASKIRMSIYSFLFITNIEMWLDDV